MSSLVVCGTLLASMIDEAKDGKGRNIRGLLFGNRSTRNLVTLTDTHDDKCSLKSILGNNMCYLNYRFNLISFCVFQR